MAGKVSDEELLHALRCVEPLVQKIGVKPRDPQLNLHFLDLDKVCYITTEFTIPDDLGIKASTMFTCDDGSRWYNNMGLLDLEKLFADGGNPWYLRTGKKYIVNVKKIRADKVSDARDLYFDGIEEPLINAVSRGDYLDAYNECPYIIQR